MSKFPVMTPETRNQNVSLSPVLVTDRHFVQSGRGKRLATVYDAVAGRVAARGFIPESPHIKALRSTASSAGSVPTESVLFRRRNAPVRYEETDFYFANESLPSNALPDSDLLKSLHCYTSDFYSLTTADRGRIDWRSLDETALLALGVLMEEICREMLGESGDMVFTTGELEKIQDQEPASLSRTERSIITTSKAAAKSGRTRTGKRRRLYSEG